MNSLDDVINSAKSCTNCAAHLPLGPKPIFSLHPQAKILIIGQAPGIKVHNTGIPWNDNSGDKLRSWLNLPRETFYQPHLISIMPMGFCYPGVNKNGGDNPPRPECAPLWHHKLRAFLPEIKLTLLVGSYSQKYYLKKRRKETMWQTVYSWREYLPEFFLLPHPSWRSTALINKNAWFTNELIPELQQLVYKILFG
jgi:uracil-DNA glycosylase